MAKKDDKVELAPVDDYPDRPTDKAVGSPLHWAEMEARVGQDQDPDYHKNNPTLQQGPQHDQATVEALQRELRSAPQKQAREAAKEDPDRYSANTP